MTRNGKIARLPREIRERLNRRLRDGDQGKVIVKWLTKIQEVREHMEEYFGGRAITEQNLSEWKQGGYQDWLKEQESREMARVLCEHGGAIAEEAGLVPLSDHLSGMVVLALGRMLQRMTSTPIELPEQCSEFISLARELNLHRCSDHRSASLPLDDENELRKVLKMPERKSSRDVAAGAHPMQSN